jgi:hypothetical protein
MQVATGKMWITIDTEMDADKHWKKTWPPRYSSICEGIPKLLRPIWNQYNVHPIYFVSPEVLYSDKCCKILKEEIRCGAIIGAHLHPEYIEPDSRWGEEIEKIVPEFPNIDCSAEVEYQKIENLTKLISQKLGVVPVWYRGARFGADLETIHILEKLGYRYDSSVTPDIDWTAKGGPDHSAAPKQAYQIARDNFYSVGKSNIIEIPLTICGKRWGIFGKLLPQNWLFYRWLRPTHMTYTEMKHLIKQLRNRKELVMMFHSMEIMVNKTPYVRNRFMQKYFLWRLKKTIQYAKKIGFDV